MKEKNATKNVLNLSPDEAFDFLMKSEHFHEFEMPEYFDFDEVLAYVRKTVGDKAYEDCLAVSRPDDIPGVNLEFLTNKDGHYAVRPLTLTNPFLYYFLVREICAPANWKAIKDCFAKFNVPHLTSCALPLVPEKVESFHQATTILNWWNSMEQRSIELSLEYRYMFVTDITNCYGSVNPQSIEWALTCRNTQYENAGNSLLANNIQKYLRAMQHGHNIGIPQGSTPFHIVAELVLGYADLLLHEALQREMITDYEIIRYRDDYRIFCNDRDTLERISYILQSVLEGLNFRMNTQKTKISDSIVLDSLKSDKLFYIYNTPIFNKKGVDFDSFEKHLLYILMFGRQFPNGGQLKVMLSDFDRRMVEWLKPDGDEAKSTYRRLVGGSVRALSAVATQIALDNVSVVHYALRIVSRMVDTLKDQKEKKDIIDKVFNKMCNLPNSDYNQLWLQNMTYTQDRKSGKSPYSTPLCQLVMGQGGAPLWNNEWLKPELADKLPYSSIVNKQTLAKLTPVITFREARAYEEALALVENKVGGAGMEKEQTRRKSTNSGVVKMTLDDIGISPEDVADIMEELEQWGEDEPMSLTECSLSDDEEEGDADEVLEF